MKAKWIFVFLFIGPLILGIFRPNITFNSGSILFMIIGAIVFYKLCDHD